MRLFIFMSLLVINFAVWSDVTDIVSVDVPPEVYMGGAASVNWVLVIVALVSFSVSTYLFRQYIESLKERISDMAKITLMLRESSEVIEETNKTRKELLLLMQSVREVIRGCPK